jgi:GT2 family glycosyltransferase
VTTTPLISIVTPCRNAARHLPWGLESVARGAAEAGVGTIEHIIMDGGSRDGSADLIRQYAEAHPGLVSYWESRPDGGQADAINRGLGRARGRYGAWLNADDRYEPGALRAVAEYLMTPAAPDVLVGRCRFIDEAGQAIMEPRPPEPLTIENFLRLRTQWFHGRCLVQPEVFFKMDWFRNVEGLDASNHYTMDHDLWCRLLLAGARFGCIDVSVASAGVHEGQKTHNNREVARSMLRHSLAIVRDRKDAIGDEAPAVLAELTAVGTKLEAADAIIRWWQRGLDPRAPRHTIASEDQPLPPAGSGEALELIAAAAARALRWKPRLRVGLAECDPHIAPQVAASLGWRTAQLHIASRSKLTLSQTSAGLRSRRRLAITAHHGPLAAGSLDLIVAQSVSIRAQAVGSFAADLWSRLAPGGVLILLDDPLPSPSLRAYIGFLSKRLGDNITANHDVLLHPEADGFLRRVMQTPQPPAIAGLDPHEIIPRLSGDAACLLSRSFGTCADHPMTAFVPLGPPEVSGFASWVSSAWRKG